MDSDRGFGIVRYVEARFGGSRREEEDPAMKEQRQALFRKRVDEERRKRKPTSQRKDPRRQRRGSMPRTVHAPARQQVGVKKHNLDDPRFYVAPPGMEHIVKKLKKKEDIDNPFAVAWSMHNKEKDKHVDSPSGSGVLRLGPRQDAFQRNLNTLEMIENGTIREAAESVVQMLYNDAVSSLTQQYADAEEGGLNFRGLWRHVLDETYRGAREALKIRKHAGERVLRFATPDAPGTVSGQSQRGNPSEDEDQATGAKGDQGPTDSANKEMQDKEKTRDLQDRDDVQEEATGRGGGIDKHQSSPFDNPPSTPEQRSFLTETDLAGMDRPPTSEEMTLCPGCRNPVGETGMLERPWGEGEDFQTEAPNIIFPEGDDFDSARVLACPQCAKGEMTANTEIGQMEGFEGFHEEIPPYRPMNPDAGFYSQLEKLERHASVSDGNNPDERKPQEITPKLASGGAGGGGSEGSINDPKGPWGPERMYPSKDWLPEVEEERIPGFTVEKAREHLENFLKNADPELLSEYIADMSPGLGYGDALERLRGWPFERMQNVYRKGVMSHLPMLHTHFWEGEGLGDEDWPGYWRMAHHDFPHLTEEDFA